MWYLISLKNKYSHSKVFFENKRFAEFKALASVLSKMILTFGHKMSFPIKYLLREHKSFALYSLSAGTSQIINNFSLIFFDLFTEKLFYESRFSDWQLLNDQGLPDLNRPKRLLHSLISPPFHFSYTQKLTFHTGKNNLGTIIF